MSNENIDEIEENEDSKKPTDKTNKKSGKYRLSYFIIITLSNNSICHQREKTSCSKG